MKKRTDDTKNISLQIPAELHRETRVLALRRGVSMRDYIVEAIRQANECEGIAAHVRGQQLGAQGGQTYDAGSLAAQHAGWNRYAAQVQAGQAGLSQQQVTNLGDIAQMQQEIDGALQAAHQAAQAQWAQQGQLRAQQMFPGLVQAPGAGLGQSSRERAATGVQQSGNVWGGQGLGSYVNELGQVAAPAPGVCDHAGIGLPGCATCDPRKATPEMEDRTFGDLLSDFGIVTDPDPEDKS